jgi:group II intron reverse transcriptase/maturase
MKTGLQRLADKAKSDKKLRFTSILHHLTPELIKTSLARQARRTGTGVDGMNRDEALKTFESWQLPTLTSIHRGGYHAPPVRRVWIPKPGKEEKRPIGVPTVIDRAVQRSVASILETIYEQDFLPNSFGGRPALSAHHALMSLSHVLTGEKVRCVLECDLKNFFGSLDHGWVERFISHRIGDPRVLALIRKWLKAGVMEAGEIQNSDVGTPQGGSISVLISNVYLHYVLDLWFEKIVKKSLRGKAFLVRYLDDFVIAFENETDARRVHTALIERLKKFSLELEPTKTRMLPFGRLALWQSENRTKKKPETFSFLGFTICCARSRNGSFMVRFLTERKRLYRALSKLTELLKRIYHQAISEQIKQINQVLRGHYLYYGVGGNGHSLKKVHRHVKVVWRKCLSRRSQRGAVSWLRYAKILKAFPLQEPRLSLPYTKQKTLVVSL